MDRKNRGDLCFLSELISLDSKSRVIAVAVPAQPFQSRHAVSDGGGSSGSTDPAAVLFDLSPRQAARMQEGHYYYFFKGARVSLSRGNTSPEARREFYLNNVYRSLLFAKSGRPKSQNASSGTTFSYHVNVGHGNCSLIVRVSGNSATVTMVDCSIRDRMTGAMFWDNVAACLAHISTKFTLATPLAIDRFFLTHPHYDHYNGIPALITNNHIRKTTETWINAHYSWPESRYSDVLRRIHDLGCPIVEPVAANGAADVVLWHPPRRVVRSKTRKYSGKGVLVVEVPKINIASAVYEFTSANRHMVFPGDLEYTRAKGEISCDCRATTYDYYCLSHHGSSNGHARTICPHAQKITSIADCMTKSRVAILMGRDNAYPGIYDPGVLAAFAGRLHLTEGPPTPRRFLELDWATDSVSAF